MGVLVTDVLRMQKKRKRTLSLYSLVTEPGHTIDPALPDLELMPYQHPRPDTAVVQSTGSHRAQLR